VTEAQSNTLQTIIDEFKTLSPETANALIFKNDGQTIANTEATSKDQNKKLILNFENISHRAETIGGIESLIIQADDKQLNIIAMNSLFLATVSSRSVNQEIIKSLTHVVVPMVVELIDQIGEQQIDEQQPENELPEVIEPEETQFEEPEPEPLEESVLPAEDEHSIQPVPEPMPERQKTFEPILPSTPINQFMVEKIGGFLVPADLVRIDGEVLAKWSDLYDGKQIIEVSIEALDGKKTTCKVKAIKEAKTNSKGVIQIPEKILQTLQIEKGKLVMVGPIIEQEE
jgi:hypothetical protein